MVKKLLLVMLLSSVMVQASDDVSSKQFSAALEVELNRLITLLEKPQGLNLPCEALFSRLNSYSFAAITHAPAEKFKIFFEAFIQSYDISLNENGLIPFQQVKSLCDTYGYLNSDLNRILVELTTKKMIEPCPK